MRIPPDRHPEILSRSSKGESADTIAAWLATVGITVTGRAIRMLLEKHRKTLGEVATVAAREAGAKTVAPNLQHLDGIRERLAKYEDQAAKDKDFNTAIRAARAQADVVDKALHYAGADAAGGVAEAARVVILPALDPE